ncbi:hypothetical protein [Streptomyces sp. NBC_00316]|uniref:hypothetical protein n=1 Tax=Streptomyces sp. NBC_00316 TaxID=2975710 RepID=UPI003FA6C55C
MARNPLVEAIATVLGVAALALLWFAGPGGSGRRPMPTPFSFRSPAEMSCVSHRGGTGKRLFLLHHFITVAGGSRIGAGKVNARDRVLHRAHRCAAQRGSPVSVIAVDRTTIGPPAGRSTRSTRSVSRTGPPAEPPAAAPDECGVPRPGGPWYAAGWGGRRTGSRIRERSSEDQRRPSRPWSRS